MLIKCITGDSYDKDDWCWYSVSQITGSDFDRNSIYDSDCAVCGDMARCFSRKKRNMKKTIATMMTGLMVLSLSACGSVTASKEAPAAEAATEAAVETATEETAGLANPWRDATEEECYRLAGNGFSAPEGATNVKWSIMDTGEEYRELVQMTFDLDRLSFTARQQNTGDDPQDISGMFYEWAVEDDVTLANWAGGNMKGTVKRFVGEDRYVDVCTWYDVETGASYSLSTEDKDLDGFDIQAVAEAIYDPNKQFGANAAEDDPVLQRLYDESYSGEILNFDVIR